MFNLGLLSICIEYGLQTWPANTDEIIVLELHMQLIGNQNSLRTWVRTTEDVRLLKLEVNLLVQYMSSINVSRLVTRYVYKRPTFRFIY